MEDVGSGTDLFAMDVLRVKRSLFEVGKPQPFGRVGQRRRIACLVMPRLKVRCLDWADTEQDAQHFQIGGSLSQRGIEAAAPLLDKPKMEARRVGDRLDVVSRGQIGIRSGNGRKLPF